jgi:hypothetical protein
MWGMPSVRQILHPVPFPNKVFLTRPIIRQLVSRYSRYGTHSYIYSPQPVEYYIETERTNYLELRFSVTENLGIGARCTSSMR